MVNTTNVIYILTHIQTEVSKGDHHFGKDVEGIFFSISLNTAVCSYISYKDKLYKP